jgi:hypothetical protein
MHRTTTRGRKVALGLALAVAVAAGAALLRAADHRDSAFLTTNPGQDIADVYSFRNPSDPSRLVLAMTVAGLQAPSDAGTVQFPSSTVYQFKIDTDGDAVEDYVIQAYPVGAGASQVIKFLGPAEPIATGTVNQLLKTRPLNVPVSYGSEARVASRNGMSVFAGLRDDPFFFDLVQFRAIVGGTAAGWRDPGVDTFAGTNVLALVVEFPVALLGGATQLGIWGTVNTPAN